MNVRCFFSAVWHRERGFVAVEITIDDERYIEHMSFSRFGEFCGDLREHITVGEWKVAYAPGVDPELVEDIQDYFKGVLVAIIDTLSDEADEADGLTE